MSHAQCTICASRSTHAYARRDSYRYALCDSCGAIYLHPTPSPRTIRALYDKSYTFRVDHATERRFIAQAKPILTRIRMMAPGLSLLDIGTGYGTFVRVAHAMGYQAVGLEPARNLYDAARRINPRGIIRDSYQHYLKSSPSYDAISMIHVIEHVENPRKTLEAVIKKLTPGGVLFIETPNADSHLRRAEGASYTFLTPPDHITLFSPKSLSDMIHSIAPTAHISTTTYSYPEHLMGVAKRYIKTRSAAPIRQQLATRKNIKPTANSQQLITSSRKPFLDTYIAPILTPLLNIGNHGSVLQMYIKI